MIAPNRQFGARIDRLQISLSENKSNQHVVARLNATSSSVDSSSLNSEVRLSQL